MGRAGTAEPAVAPAGVLPETAAVAWRPRIDERALRLRGRLWTLSTAAHTVPFVVTAAVLVLVEAWLAPVAALALVHAWAIPELYAKRGANVVRPQRRRDDRAEATALGLLGDLVGQAPRELHSRTGLVAEHGRLGVWLVGEAGTLLVRPGGRRVHCWCVRADDASLPAADRIAHLLLALREDEHGFATVANLAFSGAAWRVRRRMEPRMRPALDEARRLARATA
jgi:hypothetical protein